MKFPPQTVYVNLNIYVCVYVNVNRYVCVYVNVNRYVRVRVQMRFILISLEFYL